MAFFMLKHDKVTDESREHKNFQDFELIFTLNATMYFKSAECFVVKALKTW